MTFTYNLLIVEDHPEWRDILVKSINKIKAQNGYSIFFAFSDCRTKTNQELENKHFHFVSLDQRLPERSKEMVVTDKGLTILEDIVNNFPVTARMLYTHYPATILKSRAEALDNTPYIQKSFDGKDHTDNMEKELTPRSWARMVFEILESYHEFAIPRMSRYLPPGMAERAGLMHEHADSPAQFLSQAILLWESCLYLIWAHALAIANRIPDFAAPRMDHAGDPASLETALLALLPAIAREGWFTPWHSYLGGDPETGSGAGQRFLEQASLPWRTFRDTKFHHFSHEEWAAKRAELKDPLLHLLDALSYWTVHPLRTEVQIDSGYHTLNCHKICGSTWPWPQTQCYLPDSLDLNDIFRNHIYIHWIDGHNSQQLLDLHPFILLREVGDRPGLWTLSHYDPQTGGWFFRSLESGAFKVWPLAPKEIEPLAKFVPSSS